MNRRPTIDERSCPDCGQAVDWGEEGKSPSKPTLCMSCNWEGPFYNTIPRPPNPKDGKRVDDLYSAFKEVLEFEVASEKAFGKFQNFMVSNPNADNDETSQKIFREYIDKVGQIKFLINILSLSSVDPEVAKHIVGNEVNRLFPNLPMRIARQ